MNDTFTTLQDRPIHWKSKDGTIHACEGADVHQGVRLIWTKCQRDVPANEAFLPATPPHGEWEPVNCLKCLTP